MAETTKPPELWRSTLNIANLPEEILSEIFLLLPPKSVLLSRAVCKAWRQITSDRAFLLSHHRRQPQRRLLTFVRDVGTRHDNLGLVDCCVEALDFRKREFRSVVRFTFDDYDCLASAVHAACDGLLLMSFRNHFYLCNPTTRQWVSVFPPALKHVKAAGLYVHDSEYRVLYYREIGLESTFYISSVGSGSERCIRPHSLLAFVRKLMATGSDAIDFDEPFLFHGNMHWAISLPNCSYILVFDTIAEVFWLLDAPVKNLALVSSLLEIDGMLSISNSNVGGSKVNLWLLQDYKGVVWVHKYRIKLPVLEISRFEEHGAANPGGEARSWRSKISRRGTSSGTFTGPNPRRPKNTPLLFQRKKRGDILLTPSPRNKNFFSRFLSLNPSIHLSPPFQIRCLCSAAASPCVVVAGVPGFACCSLRFQQHHGRGIRQCLRRRRIDVLLLRAPRHPQERLRHRHTLCVPEARDDLLTCSDLLPWARRSGTRTGGPATPARPARPSGGSSGSRRHTPFCRTRGRRPCTTPGSSIPSTTTTRISPTSCRRCW